MVADASSVLGAAAASSSVGKAEEPTPPPASDTAIIEGFDLNISVSHDGF